MSLRVYADRLVVAAEGQIVCEHTRIIDRRHDTAGQTVYDWRHYLAVLQRKPGALRNGAPFAELPAGLQAAAGLPAEAAGGDREMVEILALVLHHDEQAVLTAVELALEAGVPTKTHVLNVLHRLLDGKPPNAPTGDRAAGAAPGQRAAGQRAALRHAARPAAVRADQEIRHAS